MTKPPPPSPPTYCKSLPLSPHLDRKDHPDEARGQQRDAERARPDQQQLVDGVLPVDLAPGDAPEGLAAEHEAADGALEPARRVEGVEEAEESYEGEGWCVCVGGGEKGVKRERGGERNVL